MQRMTTARRDRLAQPGVPYEQIKFSNPADREMQALQIRTAEQFGWHVADFFATCADSVRLFRRLVREGNLRTAEAIRHIIESNTEDFAAALNEAGARTFTPKDTEEYMTAALTIEDKYGEDWAYNAARDSVDAVEVIDVSSNVGVS